MDGDEADSELQGRVARVDRAVRPTVVTRGGSVDGPER